VDPIRQESLVAADKFADGYHEFVDSLIGSLHAFVSLPHAFIGFAHPPISLLHVHFGFLELLANLIEPTPHFGCQLGHCLLDRELALSEDLDYLLQDVNSLAMCFGRHSSILP
jgi:hypothetical protein